MSLVPHCKDCQVAWEGGSTECPGYAQALAARSLSPGVSLTPGMVQKEHKSTHTCTERARGKAINITPTDILKEGGSGSGFAGLTTSITHGAKPFSLTQEFVRHMSQQ